MAFLLCLVYEPDTVRVNYGFLIGNVVSSTVLPEFGWRNFRRFRGALAFSNRRSVHITLSS
ncbi:MAG: hypothetical protein WBV61_02195 [Rhodanobacteraceae bacterium]